MPIMLPPGQGVTVQLPQGGTVTQPAQAPQQAPEPAPKPEPFRRVPGPDVALLPHGKPPASPKPQQMARHPMQFDRGDAANMHASLMQHNKDVAAWGGLADYFEENDKPAASSIMRKSLKGAQRSIFPNDPYMPVHFDHNMYFTLGGGAVYSGSHPETDLPVEGSIHGVPISVKLWHPYGVTSQSNEKQYGTPYTEVFVHGPTLQPATQHGKPIKTVLSHLRLRGREHYDGLINEFDEPEQDNNEPQQMQRAPMRYSREDAQRMFDALYENPHDRGRWNILADYFEENGLNGASELFNGISKNGTQANIEYSRYLRDDQYPDVRFPFVEPNPQNKHHITIHGIPLQISKRPIVRSAWMPPEGTPKDDKKEEYGSVVHVWDPSRVDARGNLANGGGWLGLHYSDTPEMYEKLLAESDQAHAARNYGGSYNTPDEDEHVLEIDPDE